MTLTGGHRIPLTSTWSRADANLTKNNNTLKNGSLHYRHEHNLNKMKLLYYPGCTLKTSAKNLEKSAYAIMEKLGYELVEMDDWTCCGVVASLTDDDLMHHLAPLRNLIHAEDEGEETVITLCDMCRNTLKQTNLRVKENPDDLETLNLFMDKENDYKGTIKIVHFFTVQRLNE